MCFVRVGNNTINNNYSNSNNKFLTFVCAANELFSIKSKVEISIWKLVLESSSLSTILIWTFRLDNSLLCIIRLFVSVRVTRWYDKIRPIYFKSCPNRSCSSFYWPKLQECSSYPKIQQIFRQLLQANLSDRDFQNSPFWSH